MIQTDLRFALRALRRHAGFTALNSVGLAVGMACCLLIGLYVQHELSYDRHHPASEQTYRVVQRDVDDGGGSRIAGDGVLEVVEDDVPGIETIARVFPSDRDVQIVGDGEQEPEIRAEDQFAFADPSVFDVFAWRIVNGDAETALAAPESVVMTESAAERYFGSHNPIGRALQISQNGRTVDLTVTAVMADPRTSTHLDPGVLASFDAHAALWGYGSGTRFGSFWYPSSNLYVVMQEGVDLAAAEDALRTAGDANRDETNAAAYDLVLEPITDIHLYSEISSASGGSPQQVYLFIAIALFVLGIAGVNFVNLATAQGTERTREIGVRLSLGAHRGQIARQLLIESLLVSAFAGMIAVSVTIAVFPAFETLVDVELGGGIASSPWLWGGVVAVVLATGIGAGSYPAFLLTSVDPSAVLSRRVAGLRQGVGLRKSLVVLQFAISAALIVGATIAFQQLRFVQNADLGFDEEALVTVAGRGNYETLREQLTSQSGIQAVVGVSATPGLGARFTFETYVDDNAEPEDESFATQYVDFGYFEMLGVETVAGRTFSEDRPADLGRVLPKDEAHFNWYTRERAVVVNEAMARRHGWTPEEAIGKSVRSVVREGDTYYTDTGGTIIGVVEDFHYASLRNTIEPLVLYPAKVLLDDESVYYQVSRVLVQVAPGGTPGSVMETLRRVWNDVAPGEVLEASFVSDRLDALYEEERRSGWMVGTFAGLAIFVACLGLFGLAAFAARQRTKEIGIRKAVGASATSIVRMITSEYLILVGVAVVIAAPIAYLGMAEWITAFAYRIDLGGVPFFVALGVVGLVATIAVGGQALRAARVNPALTLRDE